MRYRLNSPLTPSPAWGEQCPAVAPLELTKLLTELGKATFRASGTCMYPGVRPGDLLHIEARSIREIMVGEIAVFRREGQLFAHRTIATGEDGRGPYIITRPDRARSGGDGPSYERDLLGVVTGIERNGRLFGPERSSSGCWARGYYFCCLTLIEWGEAALARLERLLLSVQQSGLYRRVARFWFARPGRALDFVAQAPLHSRSSSPFSQKFAGREIDAFDLNANGHGPEQWTITIRVNSRPAASLDFSLSPVGSPRESWWVAGAHTRIRYRGTGVEEKLFRKAAEILARAGVRTLRVSPPEGLSDAWRWQDMGFREMTGSTSREPADDRHGCARRIVLEADIMGLPHE